MGVSCNSNSTVSLPKYRALFKYSNTAIQLTRRVGTPPGTFFAVIGISLGFNDPTVAQYVGFALHLLTGTVAGYLDKHQHIGGG